MKLSALAGLLALAACGSTPTTPRSPQPAPDVPATPAPVAEPEPAPCTIEGRHTEEDLDGDGKPEPIVWNDRQLCVAGRTLAHGVGSPDELEPRIIDIDPAQPGRELVLIDPGIEDDAVFYVFVWDGDLRFAGEVFVGNEPVIEGDGTLVTHNGNCGQSTVVVWRLDGDRLKVESEETTGTYDDMLCAACPFVYIERDGELRYAGEILRNLRGPNAETLQALPLPRPDVRDGIVTVRVTEEKLETTYLDVIYLEVDGVSIAPIGCERGGAWCNADGDYQVIAHGDVRVFRFDVGRLAPGARVTVQARGYYVPHAWR